MKKRQLFKPQGSLKPFNKMLLVMKLLVITLITTFFQANAEGFSQKRLTLKIESADLRSVIGQIEKKSQYRFLYSPEILNKTGKISVNVNNEYVPAILDKIFQGSTIS